MNGQNKMRFFSLVELLIVISVIAILMSLLSPALRKVMYKAKTVACSTNLKQIGNGVMMYVDDNGDLYPSTGGARSNPTVLGEWEIMLPYHGGDSLAMRKAFMCPHVEEGWKVRMVQPGIWRSYDTFPFLVYDNGRRIPYNLYFRVKMAYDRMGHNDETMNRVGDLWKAGGFQVMSNSKYKYNNILGSDVLGHNRGNHIPLGTVSSSEMVELGGHAPAAWTFTNYQFGNGNYLYDDLSVRFHDLLHRNFTETTGDAGSSFQFPLESFSEK